MVSQGSGEAKKVNPIKSILSGGIAGGVEICITYPTEYVKTVMQLYENQARLGVMGVVKDTVSGPYGVLGLYRGLSSLLYFSIPKSGVRFVSYEMAKNHLQDSNGHMSTGKIFLAGLTAGVAEAIFVTTVAETMKVKLIHDRLSPNPKYQGFVHGVTSIAKQQGLMGCYKGLLPTIIKQGSNQAIRFSVFMGLKNWMLDDPNGHFSIPQSVFAGVLAGAASVFGNTPIDVVKTRMQGLEASKYRSTWHCIVTIFKNEGILAFYKGTVPRLGRVCADVAIQMTLYTELMKFFDYLSNLSK